ncbi:hypothetical protein P170DRAFT_513454 [Aspergillus steynii IBT 23096]|uniref:Uncharacterized protein n=1 Tax=Aspergillus steynii IBT 23096 TaxID=1392250 RepID=A0A2I2FUA7_9EURO|nr:uncharacterized protein P170DRAFT_513454 [Aspergillus steynii IBT 23096]PLB44233.1 hypothetical protein P170DRAFT_513454 [Aspergillus steynii IBT 23096]
MIFHDLDVYPLDENSSNFVNTQNPVRASTADSEKLWQPLAKPDLILPSHLDTILEDYMVAFDGDQMNPGLISSRVDAILLSIVAAAKSKHPGDSSGLYPKDDILLSIGETLTTRDTFDTEQHYFRCLSDATLWYGETKVFEANLIVRKTSGPVDGGSVTIPGALLMMLYGRRLLEIFENPEVLDIPEGLPNSQGCGMYGIVTDSYKWHFLWVHNGYHSGVKYFQATFDWTKENERQRIINHVRDIVDHAISLAGPKAKCSNTAKYTASVVIGCLIWDEYRVDKSATFDYNRIIGECDVNC